MWNFKIWVNDAWNHLLSPELIGPRDKIFAFIFYKMHLRDVSEGREINAWRVCRLLSVESIFCELFYLNINLQMLCFLIWASTQKECVCVFFYVLTSGSIKRQKQISDFNFAICYVKYSLKESHPSQNLEYEVSWDDKPVLKLSCQSLWALTHFLIIVVFTRPANFRKVLTFERNYNSLTCVLLSTLFARN